MTWGLVSSAMFQRKEQEEMALSCAMEGSDWILEKQLSLEEWLGIGITCPGWC